MLVLNILCLLSVSTFLTAKPHDPKTRVYDKEPSEFSHFDSDAHDTRYDHEAFLGKNTAKKFEQLTPTESRERLGDLVKLIDTDADGFVTSDELKAWLKKISMQYINEDVERSFEEYKREFNSNYVTFEHHKSKLSDEFDDDTEEDSLEPDFRKAVERDKRRFDRADVNGDGQLTKEEFAEFLHPEESERMRDIVVEETMDDLDKNGDGVIDLEEYTSDMWDKAQDSAMPDWVRTERKQFEDSRDKDRNGWLDKEEVYSWLFPTDYDHIESEVKHLISEADEDNDGKLSKVEIIQNYDLFVGSQATNFGQALQTHEEL